MKRRELMQDHSSEYVLAVVGSAISKVTEGDQYPINRFIDTVVTLVARGDMDAVLAYAHDVIEEGNRRANNGE
jgi:hypothetical protein